MKENVQPYYIIDPERKSVRYEMRAMQDIKAEVFRRFPEAEGRILPTIYVEKETIKDNQGITRAYEKVCGEYPIGIQYEWLARFSRQVKPGKLELTIEKGVGAMNELLMKVLDLSTKKGHSGYTIKEDLRDKNSRELFRDFSFPVIGIYKSDMIRESKAHGFFDIMEKTWFCHNPLPNGKPCGVCVPCTQIVKEGMIFRMPLITRIRYYLRVFLSKEELKNCCPGFYDVLRRLRKVIKHIGQ